MAKTNASIALALRLLFEIQWQKEKNAKGIKK
jgi:hypothetical protein